MRLIIGLIFTILICASCKTKNPFSSTDSNLFTTDSIKGNWSTGCRVQEYSGKIYSYNQKYSFGDAQNAKESYYSDHLCTQPLTEKSFNIEVVSFEQKENFILFKSNVKNIRFAVQDKASLDTFNQLGFEGGNWELNKAKELSTEPYVLYLKWQTDTQTFDIYGEDEGSPENTSPHRILLKCSDSECS